MDLFFYGTLRDKTLLKIVLDDSSNSLSFRSVGLADHAVHWAKGQIFPMISESTGETAQGLLVQGLTEDHIARLNFYEGGFDYELRDIAVDVDGQSVPCQVYWPEDPSLELGEPWVLSDWQRDWGELSHEAAREAMGLYGEISATELQWQFPRIRARADARLRAQKQPAPTTVRSGMTTQDVTIEQLDASHRGFYAVDTMLLRHTKFDGTISDLLRREVFKSSDASIVLPYDPVTDQILMVEQLRMGPTGRADPVPWCLEPVAGLVDPGESPEETAHREAWEEAGVKFTALETVANGYSSPGASTGYFFLYIGLCDLTDHNSDQSGILDEGEDIRSHIISFDHAMELVDTGEINVLPTILCLNWLARHRSRLRGVA